MRDLTDQERKMIAEGRAVAFRPRRYTDEEHAAFEARYQRALSEVRLQRGAAAGNPGCARQQLQRHVSSNEAP
jgi:hypothetical protein